MKLICPTITEGTTAVDVLRKTLEDLAELCEIVATKFKSARDEFAQEGQDGVDEGESATADSATEQSSSTE